MKTRSFKEVKPISSRQAMRLVLENHYSRRVVGAKYAFGLFINGELRGCVVYSQPASYTLCNGVCGKEYRGKVVELARLVVTTNEKNAASFLIGASLKMIGDAIVVSYADCNEHVGHVGYVYQATNWIYTGTGNAEPKWARPDTGEVISFTRRHIDLKAEAIGFSVSDLVKVKQVGKHRYVIFAGSKRFKAAARKSLRYPVRPYPKGDTQRHEVERQAETLFS